MVKCVDCFHADRDNVTGQRTIYEEPDMFALSKPGKEPPKIRVVRSCGVGMGYFRTYAQGDHTCATFVSAKEKEEELRSELEEMLKDFNLETSRNKLPDTNNALYLIEVMSESDNQAYGVLIDAFSMGLNVLSLLCYELNDMNIRGPQLAAAYRHCDNNIAKLLDKAINCDAEMVAFVNEECDADGVGPAVERYAAEFAHKEPDNDGADAGKADNGRAKRLNLRKSKH